VVFLEIEFCL